MKGGDPDLVHDLEDTLADGLVEVLYGRLGVDPGDRPVSYLLADDLVDHVRVDGAGPVSEKRGEMMGLARLRRFDYDAELRALFRIVQRMVQVGTGQQGRNGPIGLVGPPVAEDDDVAALVHGLARGEYDVVQGLLQGIETPFDVVEHGDHDGLIVRMLDVLDLVQVIVRDHRVLDLELFAVLGPDLEDVAVLPNGQADVGDDLLADPVQGRIGHLGEELLEVVVEQLVLFRKNGQWSVRSHGPDGLLAAFAHGGDQGVNVLHGIAEHPLSRLIGREFDGALVPRVGDLGQGQQVLVEPVPVGMLSRHLHLDLLVLDDPALVHVDQEDLAGFQPPVTHDVLGLDLEHPDLGRHDHIALLGNGEPRGTQPVAVQESPDEVAIGERHGGRTVPGLHDAGIVFVKGLLLVGHVRILLPGLGHQHHHDLREGSPGHQQELYGHVHGRRIGLSIQDDGEEAVDVLPEELALHELFTGLHTADISPQGVDLAVVAHEPERLRQVPGRSGVGREPLVHQG